MALVLKRYVTLLQGSRHLSTQSGLEAGPWAELTSKFPIVYGV